MYIQTNSGLGQVTSPEGVETLGPLPRPLTEREVMLVAKGAGDLWGDKLGNIDVFAQKAIVRLSNNPLTAADAYALLNAVKSRELRGIFIENQKVPTLRARNVGRWWWEIIPKGEDATLQSDPSAPISGAPIIVFRDTIRSIPSRLDSSLLKAFAIFQMFLKLKPGECDVAQSLMPEKEVDMQFAELPDTDQCKVPLINTCSRMKKLDKAVCEFKARLKNPWLVCYGQSYWSLLAKDVLGNGKSKKEKCDLAERAKKRHGKELYCALRSSYLTEHKFSEPWPKSPFDLRQWFLEKKKRNLTWCDQKALESVSGNKCFDTVSFVMSILAKQKGIRRGKNNLGVVLPEAFVERAEPDSAGKCQIIGSSQLTQIIKRLKSTLENGYPVRAGVYPPDKPCHLSLLMRSLGHYVLIIGHDGVDTFVYWNTGQGPEESVYGNRFGLLKVDRNRFISSAGRYQVVYLDSLVPKASLVCPI